MHTKVDHSLPLYQIWVSVVKHPQFTAKPIDDPTLWVELNKRTEERLVSLVRGAGITRLPLIRESKNN